MFNARRLFSLLFLISVPVSLYAMQMQSKAKALTSKEIILELPKGEYVMLDEASALLSKLVTDAIAKKADNKRSNSVALSSTTQDAWLLVQPTLKILVQVNSAKDKAARKRVITNLRESLSVMTAANLERLAKAGVECKISSLKGYLAEEFKRREQIKTEQEQQARLEPLLEEPLKGYVESHITKENGKKEQAEDLKVERCGDCQKNPASKNCKKCAALKIVKDAYAAARATSYEDLFLIAIRVNSQAVFDALLDLKLITVRKRKWSAKDALPEAALHGRVKMLERLLEHPLELDQTNVLGATEMHLACKGGHLEAVELLWRKGSSITVKDTVQGGLPLHEAAEGGFAEIIDFLLSKKIGMKNACTNEGFSTLLLVCDRGNLNLARRLIEYYKVDVTIVTKLKRNPLHLACRSGSLPLVRYLVEELKFGIDSRTEHNETPLFFAADGGHVAIARYLCEQGADTTLAASNSLNPLFMACAKDRVEVVQFFKEERGVNLKEVRGPKNTNLLHWACSQGALAMIEYLMAEGVSLADIDEVGDTPIRRACKNSQIDAVHLLQSKFNVDVPNADFYLIKKSVIERFIKERNITLTHERPMEVEAATAAEIPLLPSPVIELLNHENKN